MAIDANKNSFERTIPCGITTLLNAFPQSGLALKADTMYEI